MSEGQIPKEIQKLSFEAALEELEAIVEGLEQGVGQLDDAIKDYERGTHLKKHCDDKLRQARERLERKHNLQHVPGAPRVAVQAARVEERDAGAARAGGLGRR